MRSCDNLGALRKDLAERSDQLRRAIVAMREPRGETLSSTYNCGGVQLAVHKSALEERRSTSPASRAMRALTSIASNRRRGASVRCGEFDGAGAIHSSPRPLKPLPG